MIDRLNVQALLDLWQSSVPEPVDCLNLLKISDENQYNLYGASLLPFTVMLNMQLIFIGKKIESLKGDEDYDKALIMRYPSHRHFLTMVAQPYYWLINNLRDNGTARLELSFTSPSDENARLHDVNAPYYLLRHNTGDDRSINEIENELQIAPVYQAVKTHDLSFISDPAANEPNPLRFGQHRIYSLETIPRAHDLLHHLGKISIDFTLSSWRYIKPEGTVGKLMYAALKA